MRSLCVLALCCCGIPAVALAEPAPQDRPPHHPLRVAELFIPPELGQVSQVREGASLHAPAEAPSKQVILIQDAHVNADAQKHLAQVLDRLVAAYGIRLILMEGGQGDVSLSYLRERGSPHTRTRVAEAYLQSGVLSGAEYLDIVSDHPLALWGVEDPFLYDAHMAVFLDVQQTQQAAATELSALRQLADRLRSRQADPALSAFEVRQAAFQSGELDAPAYLAFLQQESERVGVTLAAYPQLWRLVMVCREEQGIDPAKAEEEQPLALAQIRARAPAPEVLQLKALAEQVNAGEADPASFYEAMASLAGRVGVELGAFPNLHRYVRYLALRRSLKPQEWMAELQEVQRAVRAHLAGASGVAELVWLADRAALCERLMALEWTPADHKRFLGDPAQIQVSGWLSALREQALRLEGSFEWRGDPAALDRHLARAAQFYQLAAERDGQIARRALERMDAAGERVAVLIAGGFHTEGLVQALAGGGRVDVAVVTPWAGDESEDHAARYAAILKSKYARRKRPPFRLGASDMQESAP